MDNGSIKEKYKSNKMVQSKVSKLKPFNLIIL